MESHQLDNVYSLLSGPDWDALVELWGLALESGYRGIGRAVCGQGWRNGDGLQKWKCREQITVVGTVLVSFILAIESLDLLNSVQTWEQTEFGSPVWVFTSSDIAYSSHMNLAWGVSKISQGAFNLVFGSQPCGPGFNSASSHPHQRHIPGAVTMLSVCGTFQQEPVRKGLEQRCSWRNALKSTCMYPWGSQSFEEMQGK